MPKRCPVCGDPIHSAPETCLRCDTSHHKECWDYVPGCAVFGCAEQGHLPVSTQSLPETHRLVLEGIEWITWSGYALQSVVVGFIAVTATISFTGNPAAWAVGLFVGAVLATLISMFGAFRVKWALQKTGALALLRGESPAGDRKLARGIEERTGGTSWFPPSFAAAVLSFAVFTNFGFTLPHEWTWAYLARTAPFATVLTLALYGAIKLPNRWVGYQKVIVNRIQASLQAALPEKNTAPGLPEEPHEL